MARLIEITHDDQCFASMFSVPCDCLDQGDCVEVGELLQQALHLLPQLMYTPVPLSTQSPAKEEFSLQSSFEVWV